MTNNRKYWKSHAKESLKGRWGYGIAGTIVVQGIGLIGSMLAARIFPGDTTFSLILSQIFLFVFSIVTMIFSTGYDYMLLNMARGKKFGFNDLISMFHRGTDGILSAGLVIALIKTVVSIPFYYVAYVAPIGTTAQEQYVWVTTCLAYMMVSIMLSFLFTLPFALTFYLLADDPQMGGFAALEKSAQLMKGNMVSYVILQISFLPLLVLCSFTFGIGLLWLMPYMQMTDTVFYMAVTGETPVEAETFQSVGNPGNSSTDSPMSSSDPYPSWNSRPQQPKTEEPADKPEETVSKEEPVVTPDESQNGDADSHNDYNAEA